MNTISAIIATYGEPKWGRLARNRALPSVAEQGFDEVLHVHLSEGTLASARNEGAERATGDRLLFLDGDDVLADGFGTAMRIALAHADSRTLLTPRVQYVTGKNASRPKFWPEVEMHNGNWLVVSTLISRDLFFEVGGFREYGMYEDWALFAAAVKAGAQITKVERSVLLAHTVAGSRNSSPSMRERLYWHQRIGHDLWPDDYFAPTDAEDRLRALGTRTLRRACTS